MIKNRADFSKKLRADNQENYRKKLNTYFKKELTHKENNFKEFIIECYNKGSYFCEFDININSEFLQYIPQCEFTSVKDMFKEAELNAFLKLINNYILEEFNLKSIVEEIQSNIEQYNYIEKSQSMLSSEEKNYIGENLHIQILFKD